MKAFIFPGQGSQAIGMGRDICEAFRCARDVFQEVDEALGQNLMKIIFEGPESELVLTENTQPALMAVSLAVMRVLEKEGSHDLSPTVSFVAGHSLGQYSALCAAGALTLNHTARLLKIRGQAMQEAVPLGKGAMAALLGLELPLVEKIVRDAALGQVCEIANDNSPGQVVISGHLEAVERGIELSKERGAKRSLLLNVSAPFHCALMEPAQIRMKEALTEIIVQDPMVPLMDNVSADVTQNGQDISAFLVRQVTGRVRWRESVIKMAEQGVTTTVEIGSGKVLTGLSKRIVPSLEAFALNTPHDIESYLKRNG
ncbi:MAG: ACP S-malonyltransferase [Alphaproteobacteria bacterium]|nr:ACP S-malonyltransferase [Alphaproteobacteria bacterium]